MKTKTLIIILISLLLIYVITIYAIIRHDMKQELNEENRVGTVIHPESGNVKTPAK